MESRVRVNILREMRFWSEKDIEREPVRWFRFEETFKFNTLPEIFVQFIQLHLKKNHMLQGVYFSNYYHFRERRG